MLKCSPGGLLYEVWSIKKLVGEGWGVFGTGQALGYGRIRRMKSGWATTVNSYENTGDEDGKMT